jgi:hypothetical protein
MKGSDVLLVDESVVNDGTSILNLLEPDIKLLAHSANKPDVLRGFANYKDVGCDVGIVGVASVEFRKQKVLEFLHRHEFTLLSLMNEISLRRLNEAYRLVDIALPWWLLGNHLWGHLNHTVVMVF